MQRDDVVIFHANEESKILEGYNRVLGDSRANSSNSRYELGLIKKDQVVGKAVVSLFSLDAMHYGFYSDSFDVVNK